MLTVLTTSALRWMEHHRQRAALRRLLEQDDRALRDIGVRRSEIERALRTPSGENAAQEAGRPSRASLMVDPR